MFELDSIRLKIEIVCKELSCCILNAPQVIKKGKQNNMSVLKAQLHQLHNPFADVTSQPKIPDGKVDSSLGFQTQIVKPIANKIDQSTVELVLFAGMNAAVTTNHTDQANLSDHTTWTPGFVGSNAVDWSAATDPATDYVVETKDDYNLWRTVSAGMRLKLMNSVEEDDGWWEAIRITPEFLVKHYRLATVDNATDRANSGTLVPTGLFAEYSDQSLVNENSYSTGLLRDLQNVQFDLHGRLDHHDFVQKRGNLRLEAAAQNAVNLINMSSVLKEGHDDAYELINQFIDPGYDMIYIRLHCRPNVLNSETHKGSRFHMNVISNQEIVFDNDQRESRFQTPSISLGAAAATHLNVRRAIKNASRPAV